MAITTFVAVSLWYAANPDDLYSAKAVAIIDGDTIDVRTAAGETIRIRLAAIDAPERGQPWSRRAKERLGELCHEQQVVITEVDRDRHNRLVAWIHLADADAGDPAQSVNAQLIADGLAWHYVRYDQTPALSELEATAKAGQRGLWSDPDPVTPWEWRRNKAAKRVNR